MSKTVEQRLEAVERFLGFPVEVAEAAPAPAPAPAATDPVVPADVQSGDAPSA